MIRVTPLPDAQRAVPLLSELRAALDPQAFEHRLSAALAAGYRLLGAEREGDLIGVLGYRIVSDLCWGKTFYIDDLNVAPTARSAGVGHTLLDAAKDAARTKGCDHLRLCSGLTRADAHRFYEANGLQAFSKQFVLALKGN